MNRARILAVADAIEQRAIPWLGFDMRTFLSPAADISGENCGTVACIAGWTIALFEEAADADQLEDLIYGDGAVSVRAARLLDLDLDPFGNGYLLFFGHGDEYQAVRTLRHLADHGTVDWSA